MLQQKFVYLILYVSIIYWIYHPEHHLLNLQFLRGILTHMLEQTQIRGRVWSENMELLNWMRTEGIYCSSVVPTDSASWISFSSTERFQVYIRAAVLKLGSSKPQGFDEWVTGIQLRLGLCNYNALYNQARQLMQTADVQQMNSSL